MGNDNNISKTAYLFSFTNHYLSPPNYILVYANSEEEARIIGASKCYFHSREQASPKDLILCVYGI
jgi:hypothetical protein